MGCLWRDAAVLEPCVADARHRTRAKRLRFARPEFSFQGSKRLGVTALCNRSTCDRADLLRQPFAAGWGSSATGSATEPASDGAFHAGRRLVGATLDVA